MEALGINLGFLIVQILAIFIVFLTLNAWVYKPMLNMMDARRQKIAQGLEDARVAAEARADAEKEAAKIIADARSLDDTVASAKSWVNVAMPQRRGGYVPTNAIGRRGPGNLSIRRPPSLMSRRIGSSVRCISQ